MTPQASEPTPIDRCTSIVEVLELRASATPSRPVFTFLHNGETALEPLTFTDLNAHAVRFARILREMMNPGSRVLLMLPSGYAFIEALFGCFYADCVAVPVALPKKRSTELPLVEKIARDADAAAIVTTAELSRQLRGVDGAAQLHVNAIRHILAEEIVSDTGGVSPDPMRAPDPLTLAYLQYTSGSTGDPRGVMINHANVIAAVRGSAKAFAIDEQSRFVSWLPHYHDMGLVGSLLQTIYCGAQCWVMSPQSFIAKPDRWLAAITQVGATISGGPDFAYGLCTRAASRAHEFRLAMWQCAYNGAEPVRIETLEKFAAAFAVSGFQFESFRPCYGLAEATLQVSGGPLGRAPALHRVGDDDTVGTPREHVSVSCGRPVEGTDVRIVNPESLVSVREGAVGEIWVRAPQVASGYWGKPIDNRETFEARLAGESHDAAYLRTGDAGMLADGELFVLGRFKDAIILNGVNHQPEPIEATILAVGVAQRVGTSAAIGVLIDGRERLVVVAEVAVRSSQLLSNATDICRHLRSAVHRAHDLGVHTIALVPQFALPRTTSGKVRRFKVKELFLSGQLEVLHADTVVSPENAAKHGRSTDGARLRKRTA